MSSNEEIIREDFFNSTNKNVTENEDDFVRAGKHAELLGIIIVSTIVLILIMKFLT